MEKNPRENKLRDAGSKVEVVIRVLWAGRSSFWNRLSKVHRDLSRHCKPTTSHGFHFPRKTANQQVRVGGITDIS